MKKLIVMLVMLLAFTVPVLAEDVSPPVWAGVDGSCTVLWDFTAEDPMPTCYIYTPELTDPPDPMFAHDSYGGEWDAATSTYITDGETRFYVPSPVSDGANTTFNIQVTFDSDGDYWETYAELWNALEEDGGDHEGGDEEIEPEFIDLGNGRTVGVWATTVDNVSVYPVALLGGDAVVYELIIDVVVHDGDPPTSGPGTRCGGPTGLVAQNPIPENGAILIEDDTDISWEAHPDVNEPITFDVYFGPEPNELHPDWYGNTPLVTGTTERTVLNSTLDGPLTEDTTYYWRVDTHDPNNGEPILWTGREWSFTTRPISVVITADPESVTAPAGEAVNLTVEAINAEVYQWYKADTTEPSDLGTEVPGATSDTLTIDPLTLADEGYYYCYITNSVPSDAASGRARVLTERIMAWYKFENNANDSSATGEYHGVVANDTDGTPVPTAAYVAGINGMAVDLDGIAQYVDVPHQIGPLTSATVTMWVNPDLDTADWETNIALLHDDEWTEGDFHTILFPDEVGYDINGGTALWADFEAIVGEWHFLAFVYDITGEVPVQKMYINGELAVEDESDILELPLGPLSIGGWLTIDEETELPIMSRLMDAQFDDVRIYNYPISNLNIASMYNAFANDSACFDFDIPLDFDGNCRVDIDDFVIMSEEWLLCGLVPECLSDMP